MPERTARLNELLKREISEILLKQEGFDRGVLVTITMADVSPDLSGVKIFISVIPEEKRKEVLESLRKNIYYIQHRLNKKLFLRRIPRITFCEEKTVTKAARIEELISEIHKNDN